MRCAIKRLTLLGAALMLMAVPVLAAEDTMEKAFEQGQGGKDECLLVASNCKAELKPIEQRIEKIKKEIGRGTDVYTTDELRVLQRELDNTNKILEDMYGGGA